MREYVWDERRQQWMVNSLQLADKLDGLTMTDDSSGAWSAGTARSIAFPSVFFLLPIKKKPTYQSPTHSLPYYSFTHTHPHTVPHSCSPNDVSSARTILRNELWMLCDIACVARMYMSVWLVLKHDQHIPLFCFLFFFLCLLVFCTFWTSFFAKLFVVVVVVTDVALFFAHFFSLLQIDREVFLFLFVCKSITFSANKDSVRKSIGFIHTLKIL